MNLNVIPTAPAENLRILVVEDDVFLCTFYKKFLEHNGATVVACFSLAEAELNFSEINAKFDAVLLDNQLGNTEGINLLPLLKLKLPLAAVIMVSANDNPEFFLAAFNAGIHDYMVKPVNQDLLWLKVTTAVNQQRLKALAEKQRAELAYWVEQEQEQQRLAKHLFDRMFQQLNQPHPAVHAWVKSHSLFSGDAVLRCQADDGSWYFMLADAMGHGLAPAISLMPMLKTFHSMAKKAIPLPNIVFELNDNLNRLLPDDRFIAAVLLRLDPRQQSLEIWNGGMPSVLLLDHDGAIVSVAPSTNMALGVLAKHQISVQVQRFSLDESNITYFMMFSDGLTETVFDDNGQLHVSDLVDLILWRSERPLQGIQAKFKHVPQQDDVSLCLVNCQYFQLELCATTCINKVQTGPFDVSFTLRGSSMLHTDLPKKATDFLKVQNFPIEFIQRVFTVVTEIYINALEHGVLGLDSKIKSGDDGFIRFYEEKEKRIRLLTEQEFIEFDMQWIAERELLQMRIADSGKGFAHCNDDIATNGNTFGRGLTFIETLTSNLEIIPPGNSLRLTMPLHKMN
ncbi:SpoIIE family protein phosphatase [Rheinheimera baltica]|uniref:SpoIIE family protein phosphatase n=1 Tax=Rheinheimera baltica TaxID=67576 RepID=A0ABT9I440_9GAMM|nr:SpoIIE family protein phosphatase [Rheinheimera baltica]MDP5138149.1 SpoIIE family protein phosphatase [Rheinheimera baltica]